LYVPTDLVDFTRVDIGQEINRVSATLRVVLNAWVTKTTAAEILANPATRRRQVTMTISLNTLRSTRKSARTDVIFRGQ